MRPEPFVRMYPTCGSEGFFKDSDPFSGHFWRGISHRPACSLSPKLQRVQVIIRASSFGGTLRQVPPGLIAFLNSTGVPATTVQWRNRPEIYIEGLSRVPAIFNQGL